MTALTDKLNTVFEPATMPASKSAAVTAWEEIFGVAPFGGSSYLTWDETNKRVKIAGSIALGANYAAIAPPANGMIVEGKLGVGNSNPSYPLSIDGQTAGGGCVGEFKNSNASDNTDTYIYLGKALVSNQGLAIGHHYDSDGATSSYSWLEYLGDSATDGLILKSGGKVGIGTPPGYKFDVAGNVASSVAKIFNDGNNTNREGIIIQCGLDNPTSNSQCSWIRLNDGDGTTKAYLEYSTTAGAAIYNASDARIKKNIRDTEVCGLDVVTKIPLRAFEFIDGKTQPRDIGYIAQEVLEIYPPMVSYSEQRDLYSVSDTCLIPVLVKAIQEQQAQIDGLKAEIAALKGV